MKTDEMFVGEKRVERERVEMERVTGWDGGGTGVAKRKHGQTGRHGMR